MKQRVKETKLESMMTVRDVADFLHVSLCSVRRWSARGTLKSYRIGSRGDMRYRLEDILRFLEESSVRSRTGSLKKKVPARSS